MLSHRLAPNKQGKMRITIKGGVWKNSEDEVLKAGIMKYGLQQWARVSSLLPRKTAKQCKARWYEWLDPSIKKTEWTREEEERLLHLAKLMPAQWATIAPMVGRTPAQCLEHYEKLLDAAAAGGDGGRGDPRDDPRRLRPGEIDPHPETKPARPDPVDMDEDEKEMLSEARARLANTKGKKAKRKAREKMLEDAKAMATLQKLRELKAAGIDVAKRRRKRSEGIDYATEIPFEKTAPAGFWDTGEEDARRARERAAQTDSFKATLLSRVERERASESEARERKADAARARRMMQSDLPAVLAAEAAKDPMAVRRRAPLALPPARLSDAELEEAVKLGSIGSGGGAALLDDALASGYDGGSVVTSSLLGDYRGAVGPAAFLAARHAAAAPAVSQETARRNAIMEEARNILALNALPTPLAGGEDVELAAGTGYGGATPASSLGLPPPRVAGGAAAGGAGSLPYATPGATPLPAGLGFGRGGGGGGGRGSGASVFDGSASVAGGGGVAPAFRDAMGINRDDDGGSVAFSEAGGPAPSLAGMSMRTGGGSVAFGARTVAPRAVSEAVALSLASLPAPKYAYDLLPPGAEEVEAVNAAVAAAEVGASRAGTRGTVDDLVDAGEVEALLRAAEAEAAARAFARRSAALRHDPPLPRPLVIDDDALAPPAAALAATAAVSILPDAPAAAAVPGARDLIAAEALIRDEMVALLKSDAVEYPVRTQVLVCVVGARGVVCQR